MINLAKKLWPINRSITGQGNVKSFKILKTFSELKIKKFESGNKVFDWENSNEWSIKNAHILDPNKKICDFKNNLHLVGYSQKVNKTLDLDELKTSIFIK